MTSIISERYVKSQLKYTIWLLEDIIAEGYLDEAPRTKAEVKDIINELRLITLKNIVSEQIKNNCK